MTEFRPDRATYMRAHAVMAAIAMAAAMAILWLTGNPHVWTGAVAGLAAVAVRAWYLASEALDERWVLTGAGLKGPGGRYAALDEITVVRELLGSVQIVTRAGDKHLIKYQAEPQAVIETIEAARRSAEGKARG